MTTKELKAILDLHIDSLVPIVGADFQFIKGTVIYKGFELSTTKGISPYRRS